MADVAKGVLTFGLGGDQSSMIVGSIFSLGPFKVTIEPVPPPPGGGGGPYPGPAWNKVDDITKFYDPIEQQYYEPSGKVTISITVAYKEHTVEKIYLVTPKSKEMMVDIINFLNITKSRISIGIKNIKNKTANIFAKITNLRNKR